MATSLVVDITKRYCPKFKKYPFKSIEVDPLGAFSYIPYEVLHVKDIRAYIHTNLEETRGSQLSNLYSNHLLGGDYKIKLKFKVLEEKNCIQVANFSLFEEDEWVRYVLSIIHDKFMWLSKPFMITKYTIRIVASLSLFGDLPMLKFGRINSLLMQLDQSLTIGI